MNTSDPDYRRWADAQEETNKLLRRRADKGDDAPLRSFFGGIIKGEGTMDEFFRKFREYKADLEDLNDQYRVATSVGLLSNRSMYQLDADLKSAHLSVSEFKHVLDFAGTVNFSKFGGGMNQATDNFLQISRVMQSSGLTTSLQQLGLNYQEQNELLAISFDRQKDKFAIERGPDGLPRITQSLTDRMVELGKNIALNTDILGISIKSNSTT